MGKKFLTSKTVWVSLLVFGASFLKVAGIVDVPVNADAAWVGIAWGIIQTLLRLVTSEPIVAKK